jgi:hypothetical protein
VIVLENKSDRHLFGFLGVMTGKPLIETDRVEGTTVYDPRGNSIGSIMRLMIEKISGHVAYAVMSGDSGAVLVAR